MWALFATFHCARVRTTLLETTRGTTPRLPLASWQCFCHKIRTFKTIGSSAFHNFITEATVKACERCYCTDPFKPSISLWSLYHSLYGQRVQACVFTSFVSSQRRREWKVGVQTKGRSWVYWWGQISLVWVMSAKRKGRSEAHLEPEWEGRWVVQGEQLRSSFQTAHALSLSDNNRLTLLMGGGRDSADGWWMGEEHQLIACFSMATINSDWGWS